ncbi:MAG: hypothetical protein JKY65_33510 [Planctomycetes bacterium]|nr:hypothetical protein [Planctomycetota bacterium]
MPTNFGSGFSSKNMKIGRQMLEHCRFAYKMYAQGCAFPLDPFYESHGKGGDGPRERLIKKIHQDLGSPKKAPLWRAVMPFVGRSTGVDKFDPVEYTLDKAPNPHEGVVYRAGAKTEAFILFQPRPLDLSIARARGYDISGTLVDNNPTLTNPKGNLRCAYFQGKTGLTKTHPTVGWPSWLGAVLYDPTKKRCVITFRGSRSGVGGRAAGGAQFKSAGSPDWVTDMNWLKGVKVGKYDNAVMGAGFHYAYESCKDSLAAAFRAATKGSTPEKIYLTGHSLGGGLATVAYLDLVAGDLYKDLGRSFGKNTEIVCYPISAPPIILGKEAHQKIGVNIDASQIVHYFNPKDCVHASSLIDFSGYKLLNGVLGVFSHPLTDPFHLGTEICLGSKEGFPDAHEPVEVYKGMNSGTLDKDFWPTLTFDFEAKRAPFYSGLPSSLDQDLKDALKASTNSKLSTGRVKDWLGVVKSSDRAAEVLKDFATFNEAVETLLAAKKSQSGRARALMKEKIETLRARLLKQCFENAKKHRASSSCYWVMVQLLTVDQIRLGI